MAFNTLSDLTNVQGKKILLRVDFNVPVQDGVITDATRIERALPTIRELKDKGAIVILIAHFGRPKGKDLSESLRLIADKTSELLGDKVVFIEDTIGEQTQQAVNALQAGQVAMLENVRFYPEEEKNDPDFAKQLAALGDIYVNDAFSAAHRAHASIEGVAKLRPAYAGRLMEEELSALQNGLENPQRPMAAIVGGSKVSTKLSVLDNLVQKVDYLVLGGGMQNTFFAAQGVEVGKSLCERDMIPQAKQIMETAAKAGCKIVLPIDRVTVKDFGANAPFTIVPFDQLPADQEGVDIGPATVENVRNILKTCKTVLWNGPMGVFEVKPFDNGTNGLAKAVAELTKDGTLISVAGGGDTVAALEQAGAINDFTYVSTAGGAFLEWMEGKTLPGVQVLQRAA